MNMPQGPFCQSCGMPMSMDAQHGGTEADGAKSAMYCSNCYKDGKFTAPDWTLDQMKAFCGDMMKQAGTPQANIDEALSHMGELARWKM